MAILLHQTLEDGRVIEYHRIVEVNVDTKSGIGNFKLSSWTTHEDFVMGRSALAARYFDFNWTTDDIYLDAYQALKAIAPFDSAVEAL